MKLTLFELYCTCLVHSGANTEVHFFCSYFMSELWCYSSTPSSVFFFSKSRFERSFGGLFTFVMYCCVTSIVSFTCDKPKPLLTVERCWWERSCESQCLYSSSGPHLIASFMSLVLQWGQCMPGAWTWKSHAQPRNVNQAEGFVQCVWLHGSLNIVLLWLQKSESA